MKNGKDKLIVAIDTDNFDKAKELIDQLEDSVDIFKVGLEQYVATKGKTLEYLKEKGKKVFLDLKFHDIPNTMKSEMCIRDRDTVRETPSPIKPILVNKTVKIPISPPVNM